jgi:hypothetical protein
MNVNRFCVITALLLIAVQGMAVTPVSVKYEQLPNTGWSYGFSSEIKQPATGGPIIYQSVMADDWRCNATGTVTDIHWWGSYWTPNQSGYTDYSDTLPIAANGGITGFNISIWGDVPASAQNPYSHPSVDPIKQISVSGDAGESLSGQVTTPNGFLSRNVYKYEVYLSGNDLFNQDQGTTYWLSIQAIIPGSPEKQWGWHETTSVQHDASVISRNGPGNWYIPCGGHDLAFELTTVPEPSGLLAILTGLGGILGVALRRRK